MVAAKYKKQAKFRLKSAPSLRTVKSQVEEYVRPAATLTHQEQLIGSMRNQLKLTTVRNLELLVSGLKDKLLQARDDQQLAEILKAVDETYNRLHVFI